MASLRFMLPVSGALAAVGALVGLLVGGFAGAVGVFAGVALIAALFVLSTFLLTWVESVNRAMLLGAGLTVYFVKLFVVFAVLNAVSGWSGLVSMVWGVALGVLGWVCAYAWWVWHAKVTLEFPDQPKG